MGKSKTTAKPRSSGPKTFASDVRINLGLMGTVGNLKPLRKGRSKPARHYLCPECPEPTQVKQKYVCPNSDQHGPFIPSDCTSRGVEIGDRLVALSGEELETLESDGSPVLELRVHPADQVEANTVPTGIAYRFEPSLENDQGYGVIADLAAEPDLAFIGVLTLRNEAKLFRLVRKDVGLVLVQVCWPEELNHFEPFSITYQTKYLDMAVQLVEGLRSDFNPEEYRNPENLRMAELLASKLDGVTVSKPAAPELPSTSDIEAALLASLAAVRAGKGNAA